MTLSAIAPAQRPKLNHLLSRVLISPDKWRDWNLLSPLATQFSFDELRLFAYGDAIVHREVFRCIEAHCLSQDVVQCSPILVKACGAAFCNPYNMRRVAEVNGLLELRNDCPEFAVPSRDDSAPGNSPAEEFFYSKEKPKALRAEDVRGTSFQFQPHAFCQDRLALRLSHFIAAVEVDQGAEKARAVTRRLFGLDEVVPFKRALESLAETVAFFRNTGNVTLAMLSAMGIQPLWEVSVDTENGGESTATADSTASCTTSNDAKKSTAEAILKYSAQEFVQTHQRAISRENRITSLTAPDALSVPSMLSCFLQSTQQERLVAPDIHSDGKPYTDLLDVANDPFNGDFFASSKRKFPKSSEPQHSFYEKDKDIEKGIRFDTKGLDAKSFIESYRRPSNRVFSVTVKSHSTQELIARAQASSFITARTRVLEKIMLLIAQDLHNVMFSDVGERNEPTGWKAVELPEIG